MNLLTEFHEDRIINVASRVKNAPPLGSHFHKDQKINVASRENVPPPGGRVFQQTGIIFELTQDIIGMNLLTKFHEDRTINVVSRVKIAPPFGSHVFQAKITIFELIQHIIGTNLLSKFHEDRKINVASRVLTKLYYSHIRKNAPPPGSHVFQSTGIIFQFVQDIIGMNLLTKFHEDQTINVASRVKNAPPLGSHILSKGYHYRKINVASRVLTRKNAPSPGGHVFQPTGIIFEFVQDIIGMILLIMFHEDRTMNVASRVLTRKMPRPLEAMFLSKRNHFPSHHIISLRPFVQNIIGMNLLTKFHEDWIINVASRVLTRQMLTPHDGQKAITKAHHELDVLW
ncbi:hypothetical protein DPMN_084613 [Dreissena polymorpha]|uniref:Uncharacterized protein n=1 Tax=Dreissena polymorpha TaxID=45954 RepID=A0A9D3YDG3_DREPO|nr:hypothetical protein DPMN_084613 [Dreissena polymorpha]